MDLWSREPEISIEACIELKCMREAWADLLACDSQYARSDIEMVEAEEGNYFNIVGLRATRR